MTAHRADSRRSCPPCNTAGSPVFADAVRRNRYIGACYGSPGIGKTLSARIYAAADDFDRWTVERFTRQPDLPASLLASRTAMITPTVAITHRRLDELLDHRCSMLDHDIERSFNPDYDPEMSFPYWPHRTQLLIVDEADRLRTTGLEQVRDYFDRRDIGLILIGMPGFERQLARYPQLYSRIGFAHHYLPLDAKYIRPVLTEYWSRLGLVFNPEHEPDVEALMSIVRITGGNFRLIERLMSQIGRVLGINRLDAITPDVVEAARETLVVGG